MNERQLERILKACEPSAYPSRVPLRVELIEAAATRRVVAKRASLVLVLGGISLLGGIGAWQFDGTHPSVQITSIENSKPEFHGPSPSAVGLLSTVSFLSDVEDEFWNQAFWSKNPRRSDFSFAFTEQAQVVSDEFGNRMVAEATRRALDDLAWEEAALLRLARAEKRESQFGTVQLVRSEYETICQLFTDTHAARLAADRLSALCATH